MAGRSALPQVRTAAALVAWMDAEGWSLSGLAAALGCDRSTVRRWRGEALPIPADLPIKLAWCNSATKRSERTRQRIDKTGRHHVD